jgi:peroxiredoxin
MHMRTRILTVLGVVAAIAAVSTYYVINGWNQKENENGHFHTEFRQAPSFELKDAKGQTHHLDDFKGQVVLLHFWASWCPPCLGEIPQILALAHEYEGRPLKVVTVSLDEKWPDAQKVLADPGPMVSLIDPKTTVSEQYGSFQFPETYLINGKQQIITKWIGPQDWKNENLHKLLEALLSKEAHGA